MTFSLMMIQVTTIMTTLTTLETATGMTFSMTTLLTMKTPIKTINIMATTQAMEKSSMMLT